MSLIEADIGVVVAALSLSGIEVVRSFAGGVITVEEALSLSLSLSLSDTEAVASFKRVENTVAGALSLSEATCLVELTELMELTGNDGSKDTLETLSLSFKSTSMD